MSNTKTAAIGIDVGGTAIKAGLVTSSGTVLARESIATETHGGVDHVIARIVDLIKGLRGIAGDDSVVLEGVGLGMPGTLSRRRGMILSPPNLPGWRNVPIVERVSSATGIPVLLDNDANNAALGEYRCGAGRDASDMAMLTLGTGIGGGLILGGRLFRGAHENGGELGHMIVHAGGRACRCGQLGCLEAYASADHIAWQAREAIAAGEPSSLRSRVEKDEEIRAEHVIDAAEAGDELARRIWDQACFYLGVGCTNIRHIFDVDRIVLAGGMSAAGDKLLRPVLRAFEEVSSNDGGKLPDIRIAELGNSAGFIGAALSVFTE